MSLALSMSSYLSTFAFVNYSQAVQLTFPTGIQQLQNHGHEWICEALASFQIVYGFNQVAQGAKNMEYFSRRIF